MKTFLRMLAPFFFIVAVLAPAAAAQAPPLLAPPPPNTAPSDNPVPPAPAIPAAAGILVDIQTGKVLWAKDQHTVRAPASLTKIMTALVVLENADLNQLAKITPEARAVRGSRTYAEQGWNFTVRDLLWGLLLKSGNDAAVALAQKVSPDGSVPGFMSMVNSRAAEMGATNTHFSNPHGLDEPGHHTTARDLALLTLEAMKSPVFAEMVATRQHNIAWGDGSQRTFINHNKLLARYPGAIGVKTGYTRQAGHSLASAVRREGSTLVVVTLGSVNHYAEATALYDWGFANLGALKARSNDSIQPAASPASGSTTPTDSGLIDQVLDAVRSIGGEPGTGAALMQPAYTALAVSLGAMAAICCAGLFLVRWRRPAPLPTTSSWMPERQPGAINDHLPYVTRR